MKVARRETENEKQMVESYAQVVGDYKENEKRVEELENDRWIPVSKRLPDAIEEPTEYIVTAVWTGYEVFTTSYYFDGENWVYEAAPSYWTLKPKSLNILAWQPFPAPYQNK